jgi:hypothetical protein
LTYFAPETAVSPAFGPPGPRDNQVGEQFALPVAVESLRAMKNLPLNGEIITISAADPLNLAGIVVPGERVPAISGKHVSFKDGVLAATPEAPPLSVVGRL